METLNSLQLDIPSLYRMFLIRAIGHVREHNSLMVSLAGLPPEELLVLPAETILARFLASAEHSRGIRGPDAESAMLSGPTKATEAFPKRKASEVSCFNCGKRGHMAAQCRSKKREGPASPSKRFKKD